MIKNLLLTIMLVVLVTTAGADYPSRRLASLHPDLGAVVKPEMNARYNLFGDIPNFIAAKFYEEQDGDFQLRILAANEFFILRFSAEEGRHLRLLVERRFAAADTLQRLHPAYAVPVPARDVNGAVKVVFEDETVITGRLQLVTVDSVGILTPGGVFIAAPEQKIRELRHTRLHLLDGRFYRADPNDTRLFFAPTARGLRRGEGYFADYWIFFPTVAVGMTDFLGVGAGVSILPGADSQLLYVAPKISIRPAESFSVAGGFLHLGIPDAGDLTLGYGVFTVGTSQGALTGGFGVPLTDESDEFIFLVGGEVQTSNGTKLITENWFPSQGDAILSLGVRFFGESLSADLAFITTKSLVENSNGWPFIPWVDFGVSFGR